LPPDSMSTNCHAHTGLPAINQVILHQQLWLE